MKIYDCFTFFNELDLLEMRFNILNDKVDFFVLVEATKTHSGEKKELFFERNRDRFSNFSNKIIHIIVDDLPEIKNGDRWLLENFQRDAIMRGLSGCGGNDIIVISDLDEIPRLDEGSNLKTIFGVSDSKKSCLFDFYIKYKNFIYRLKGKSRMTKLLRKLLNGLLVRIGRRINSRMVNFKQKLYYYYLNGFMRDDWIGSKAVLYKDLVSQYKSSPQQIRNNFSKIIIQDGGWHFSYLLSPEEISKKIKAFAHSEYDKSVYTDSSFIKDRIEKGENIFGRKEKIDYVKLDGSYPRFILDNLKKYDFYINHNYSGNSNDKKHRKICPL